MVTGNESAELALDPELKAYVHLVRGELEVNGQLINAQEALVLHSESRITISQGTDAEGLVFDLATRVPVFHRSPRFKI